MAEQKDPFAGFPDAAHPFKNFTPRQNPPKPEKPLEARTEVFAALDITDQANWPELRRRAGNALQTAKDSNSAEVQAAKELLRLTESAAPSGENEAGKLTETEAWIRETLGIK